MDKLAEINHGAKVVLGAAILFLIISFFNWQEVDLGAFGEAGVSMWHGVGLDRGLAAIAIIVWQAIRLANMNLEIGVGPAMVTAFLAVLRRVRLHRCIKSFADNEFRTCGRMGRAHPRDRAVAGGAWANMKLTGESIADLQKLGGRLVEPETDCSWRRTSAPPSTPADTPPPTAASGRRHRPRLLAPSSQLGPLPPRRGPRCCDANKHR